MQKIFFYATVLFFSFHVAGNIFDWIAIIPNWQSGLVEDMQRNKAFFHTGHIKSYFGIMHLACFVVSLTAMSLAFYYKSPAKWWITAAFAISFVSSVWSILYFVPMNQYFDGMNYEPEQLSRFVKAWVGANKFRTVLLLTALGFAVKALDTLRKSA